MTDVSVGGDRVNYLSATGRLLLMQLVWLFGSFAVTYVLAVAVTVWGHWKFNDVLSASASWNTLFWALSMAAVVAAAASLLLDALFELFLEQHPIFLSILHLDRARAFLFLLLYKVVSAAPAAAIFTLVCFAAVKSGVLGQVFTLPNNQMSFGAIWAYVLAQLIDVVSFSWPTIFHMKLAAIESSSWAFSFLVWAFRIYLKVIVVTGILDLVRMLFRRHRTSSLSTA